MAESDTKSLVRLLRSRSLRNRTGILLLSTAWLGRESEVAARLGISFEDYRQLILKHLAPGQRFLGLRWPDLISGHIDDIARKNKADGGSILVANIDVALASVGADSRGLFWGSLREDYRPASCLLFTLPNESRRLISEEEEKLWLSAGRLASWE